MPPVPLDPRMPQRFADLKRDIAQSIPDFETRATRAWVEILEQLRTRTKTIASEGPEVGAFCSFFPSRGTNA